jgi:hypothetical protein
VLFFAVLSLFVLAQGVIILSAREVAEFFRDFLSW